MSGVYRLVRHDGPVDRTTWWKDENTREAAGVWRIYGKGLGEEGRAATDAEIDLWHQIISLREQQSETAPTKPIRRRQTY